MSPSTSSLVVERLTVFRSAGTRLRTSLSRPPSAISIPTQSRLLARGGTYLGIVWSGASTIADAGGGTRLGWPLPEVPLERGVVPRTRYLVALDRRDSVVNA